MDQIKESRSDLLKKIYDEFILKKQDLINQIELLSTANALNTQNSLIIAELNKLQADLSTNWDLLSKYDQKSIQNQIEEIYKVLELKKEELKPKKKFQFKNRTQLRTSSNSVAKEVNKDELVDTTASDITNLDKKDTIIILNTANKYINLLPSADNLGKSLELYNISNTILNLTQLSLKAVHIKNIKNSIILLGAIQNSCLIYGMKNCKLLVGCHQFRMHDSNKTEIYLHAGSVPIIENCETLKFLNYPLIQLKSSLESTNYFNNLQQVNNWDKVQDFNWIKSTKSPNFSLIEAGEEDSFVEGLVDDLSKLGEKELLNKYVDDNEEH